MQGDALQLFGITLVGATPENGRKLLLTLGIVIVVLLFSKLVRTLLAATGHKAGDRVRFWLRQAVGLIAGIILIVGIVSIWFDDPTRLTTALGLVTAGLAFALQRVITAIAGYFIILRGKTFNVGDRIVMGGVRGDVIALSFMQTKIMEMGQPPAVTSDEPAMWVHSRQFTGRIVTVSNDKIYSSVTKLDIHWAEVEGGCHQLFGLGNTVLGDSECAVLPDEEGFSIVNAWVLAFARYHVLGDRGRGVAGIVEGSARVSPRVRVVQKKP